MDNPLMVTLAIPAALSVHPLPALVISRAAPPLVADSLQVDPLELTAKTISNVQRTPGRLRQSLAESSFDAWSKFYRPDENTPNAVVSYYAKGALVALALDLSLRSLYSIGF